LSRITKPPRRAGLLNLLTGALVALTLAIGAGYVALYLNPEAAFNPFPPGAVEAGLVDLPTPLVPLLASRESAAASPTRQTSPTVTRTPLPTATPRPSLTATRAGTSTPVATLVVIVPTGPSATPTWTRSPFRFTVQGDVPFAVENVFNLEGCNWMGIGGQVYDVQGRPLIGYVVALDGGNLSGNSLSGTQPQYGPAGYEFKLADAPKATSGMYRVQLRDPQNVPVSDWIRVETFAECTKNVLLVNFLQNH
jgi:hypothetical protein